jgi:hypothetical protein
MLMIMENTEIIWEPTTLNLKTDAKWGKPSFASSPSTSFSVTRSHLVIQYLDTPPLLTSLLGLMCVYTRILVYFLSPPRTHLKMASSVLAKTLEHFQDITPLNLDSQSCTIILNWIWKQCASMRLKVMELGLNLLHTEAWVRLPKWCLLMGVLNTLKSSYNYIYHLL